MDNPEKQDIKKKKKPIYKVRSKSTEWKTNNLKIYGRKKAKVPNYESQNQQRSPVPEGSIFRYRGYYSFVCLMVFNVTFNNISVISWWSALLVEEIRRPKKTTDLSQVTDKKESQST
jgi:hypothetical protein